MTLGGSVCIRNGEELDFCWRECINSLLPVCDVVSVCDGESTDGTQEIIRDWLTREPKLSLCVYPWPDPKGDPDFWVKWLNYAREHVAADWHLQLDADEILHEKCYDEVRKFIGKAQRSAVVTRYNFWQDHRHTIQEGICLGKRVVRLAPQNVWMASDGYHHLGVRCAEMSVPTNIEIYHYGFIRKREPFFKKERRLQNYFFNSYDPRLEAVETKEGNWMEDPSVGDYRGHLDDFTGTHPQAIQAWLKERGYAC